MLFEVQSTAAYRARVFEGGEVLVIPPDCSVELPDCPPGKQRHVNVYGTLVAGRGWFVTAYRGSHTTLTGCTVEASGGEHDLTECTGRLDGDAVALVRSSTLEQWNCSASTIDEDPAAPRPSIVRLVNQARCVCRRGKPRIYPAELASVEAGGQAIVAPNGGLQFRGRLVTSDHAVGDWNGSMHGDRFEWVVAGHSEGKLILPSGEVRIKGTQWGRIAVDARPQGRVALEIANRFIADIGTGCSCVAAGESHVTARGTSLVRLRGQAVCVEIGDGVRLRDERAIATR